MSNDLETRVKNLERKTGSVLFTMLFLVIGMVAFSIMQYRTILDLKQQINRSEVQIHE